MIDIFVNIFSRKKSYMIFLIASVIIGIIMLISAQFHVVAGTVKLFGIFDSEFYSSLYTVFSGTYSAMSLFAQVIFVLFIVSFGINTVLFVEYYRVYKNLIKGAGAHLSLFGVVMAALGTGCLSCGVLLLAPLASILGISFASWMIQHGTLISLAGLIFIVSSSYFLLKKISEPQVCAVIPE
jgi:hypothetical protein